MAGADARTDAPRTRRRVRAEVIWALVILVIGGLALGLGASWKTVQVYRLAYRLRGGEAAVEAQLQAMGEDAIPAFLWLIETSDPPGAAICKVSGKGTVKGKQPADPEKMLSRRVTRLLVRLGDCAEGALLARFESCPDPGRRARLALALTCFDSGRAREAYWCAQLDGDTVAAGLSPSAGNSEPGLDYLATRQEPGGRWNAERWGSRGASDLEVTSLAALAFMACGYTDGNGKYAGQVRRALGFIAACQRRDGRLGAGSVRRHAVAGWALAEAYGVTRTPRWEAPAQRAVEWTIARAAEGGGWADAEGEEPDAFTTGLCVMQFKSAKIAGLKVDSRAFQGAWNFLERLTVKSGPDKLLVRPRAGAAPTLLSGAAGALARLQMGEKPAAPRLWRAADRLVASVAAARADPWTAFLANEVCYKAGGDCYKGWHRGYRDHVLKAQETSGPHAGSWPLDTQEARRLGGIGTAALRILPETVQFRHNIPLYIR